MRNKSKLFKISHIVISTLLIIALSAVSILYIFKNRTLTNKNNNLTNQLANANSTISSIRATKYDCKYGEYFEGYTNEECLALKEEEANIIRYHRMNEITDSNGNFAGYEEHFLTLNSRLKTFKIDINREREGVVITGTYSKVGNVLTMNYDSDKFNSPDGGFFNQKISFLITDEVSGIIKFTGESYKKGSPTYGDMYSKYVLGNN